MNDTERLQFYEKTIGERNQRIHELLEQNKRQRGVYDHYRRTEVEALARALHMTDVDVLVFACERGEASERLDSPKLEERGPKVIEAVERMWARDELGLRTVWMERAQRVVDLFLKQMEDDLDDDGCPCCSGEDD